MNLYLPWLSHSNTNHKSFWFNVSPLLCVEFLLRYNSDLSFTLSIQDKDRQRRRGLTFQIDVACAAGIPLEAFAQHAAVVAGVTSTMVVTTLTANWLSWKMKTNW